VARFALVRATLVLAAALLLGATPGRSELRIPLRVTEPAGVAREAAPVTVGVPLPRGRSAKGAVWVADPAGRPVATQARVVERWPDGSVRWLLLDFVTAAGAHESATYTIRDGRAPANAGGPALKTTESAAEWGIDTGAAQLVLPRRNRAIVRAVRVGTGDAVPLEVTTPIRVAGQPTVELVYGPGVTETSGPVRTEIVTTARTDGGLELETRLAAFAGVPALRLTITLTSRASAAYTPIQSFPVVVRGQLAEGLLGVAGSARRWDELHAPHELRQLDARAARLDGEPLDGAGDGWVRGVGPLAVTAVRRFFAEEWPQALRVDGASLAVDLLAGADGEPVALGIGAAKTFELWLVFEPKGRAGDPGRVAEAYRRPLLAHVDPEWTAASEALPNGLAPRNAAAGRLLPRLETAIRRYLARNRAERWDDGPPVRCEERTAERERVGAFGALNWGDWNFPGYRDQSEGCDAWGNHEYDLPQVLGLAWAATGSPATWEAFVAAARHYRDVDVLHHAPPQHADWVGINHPHKASHFAFESKNKFDLGHTWLEGLLTHYRLSGELRSLQAARGIADVLVQRRAKAGNARQFGWPMIALAAAYDATGERRYREAALSYADAAVAGHEPTPAAGDWKVGILADGVAAVHAATGEARLRDWLVRYADAFAAEPARWGDARYALPLGALARLTGSARHREAAVAAADALELGDWGKTLAVSGRTAFRLLGPLSAPEAAVTPGRDAPPPASDAVRPPPSRSPGGSGRRTAN
jgi:hypothetical protein